MKGKQGHEDHHLITYFKLLLTVPLFSKYNNNQGWVLIIQSAIMSASMSTMAMYGEGLELPIIIAYLEKPIIL